MANQPAEGAAFGAPMAVTTGRNASMKSGHSVGGPGTRMYLIMRADLSILMGLITPLESRHRYALPDPFIHTQKTSLAKRDAAKPALHSPLFATPLNHARGMSTVSVGHRVSRVVSTQKGSALLGGKR